MREPVAHLGLDRGALHELVASTLQDAHVDLVDTLGPESESAPWAWGRLSHAKATHPLRAFLSESLDPSWLEVGPLPRGGSFHTVGMSGYDADHRQVVGSTVRMVIDVGEWDRSLAMNAPGQSGDPRSPFHSNLFEPWVDGETFPLLYSRDLVERDVAARILLVPDGTGPADARTMRPRRHRSCATQ